VEAMRAWVCLYGLKCIPSRRDGGICQIQSRMCCHFPKDLNFILRCYLKSWGAGFVPESFSYEYWSASTCYPLVLLGLSVKVIFLSLFQTYFVKYVYEEWLCLLVTIL
jgi:hypothetical protein